MIRARILLTVACLALAATASARAQDEDVVEPGRVRWQPLREAEARSRAEQKPLLIHFAAPSCERCKQMHRETYADPAVIRYLNTRFAMAEVDIEALPALARKFSVKGLPTVWFLDAAGQRLTRLDGFIGAEGLLPLLEFIVARDYEWTDYDTWLEHRK